MGLGRLIDRYAGHVNRSDNLLALRRSPSAKENAVSLGIEGSASGSFATGNWADRNVQGFVKCVSAVVQLCVLNSKVRCPRREVQA
jgi:hypothetical protein